ncbi:hypothetical protein PGTUg99_005363 [Puccinia graminis f. sp. tritici]|uniref:Uncharacterized protein n=1 Tax=Puccinia graminis f. sp. tritici TaxID=56615 RepID=A0A5B0SHU1_PUCGR|nr:hypothetical protein PGTUg99_005363 [Puccinia graminis f. sp. tritici]
MPLARLGFGFLIIFFLVGSLASPKASSLTHFTKRPLTFIESLDQRRNWETNFISYRLSIKNSSSRAITRD